MAADYCSPEAQLLSRDIVAVTTLARFAIDYYPEFTDWMTAQLAGAPAAVRAVTLDPADLRGFTAAIGRLDEICDIINQRSAEQAARAARKDKQNERRKARQTASESRSGHSGSPQARSGGRPGRGRRSHLRGL